MLQYIPDCNHTECYIIFQTIIQHATGHRVGETGSGQTTTVDVQTLWEAF